MTDIQTAIKELREATKTLEAWTTPPCDDRLPSGRGEWSAYQKMLRANYTHLAMRFKAALTTLETAVTTPDLDARIQAAAEEIEMAIEGYNIEQRQWARARSEAGGNIIADGFIGEALLNELNEWDANNPMPRPKTDIAKKIRRHIKISE